MNTFPRYSIARNMQGFSIPELMVVVGVTAILLSLAVPSFNNSIRDNRVVTSANALGAAVANARSEAVKRGRMVSICPSADGASCGADWSTGWIVYQEAATVLAGAAPNVELVLVVGDATNESIATTQTVGANTWIRFTSRGIAEEAVTLEVRPVTCDPGTSYQQMEMSLVGRVSFTKLACT